MGSWAKKAWAFFVLLAILSLILPPASATAANDSAAWNSGTVPNISGWSGSGNIITVASGAAGSLTVPAGVSVTINGAITNATVGLTLNIAAGATVLWDAVFTGNVTNNTPANNYLINVTGSGTLNIGSSTTIQNDGKGGAILLSSAATLNVSGTVASGGTASSNADVTGNAIRIANNNATVNVNSGGSVVSRDGNSNAALYIANNIQGALISIDGGEVVSVGTGYAICDATPFTDGTSYANNTKITLNSGIISAGSACAIRSSGTGSNVTINGGSVTNAAGNNANPTIYMSAGSSSVNIDIKGGRVESTSLAGYAIQTAGSINVSGGEVTAGGSGGGSGRAINLVGSSSYASVSGGTVQTTGTGAAISTATTNPETVQYARVEVSGGKVSSVGGNAINVTGANSQVTVSGGIVSAAGSNHTINASGQSTLINISGGEVSATTANAINTITSASNATIIVGGSGDTPTKVHSDSGRAIQTLGSNTTITIDGNCQVYVFNEGNAIRNANTNTLGTNLLGGFIFAYGREMVNKTYGNKYVDAEKVVSPYVPSAPSNSTVLVVAWNKATGLGVYPQGGPTSNNPDLNNVTNGHSGNYFWDKGESINGISYNITSGGKTLSGFFPLEGVKIIDDYGLKFTANASPSTLLTVPPVGSGEPPYGGYHLDPSDWNWRANGSTLLLDNFSWDPSVQKPLIVEGNATIQLVNGSVSAFTTSYYGTTSSYGIFSDANVTITGNGTLLAYAGIEWHDYNPENEDKATHSTGIETSTLTLNSPDATIDARGGYADDLTVGIKADSVVLNEGILNATGGSIDSYFPDAKSFGIDTPSFTMTGGTLIASGETRAFSNGAGAAFTDANITLPDNYIYWTNISPSHPTGSGAAGTIYFKNDATTIPYTSYTSDKYVKIITIPSGEVGNFAYATIDDQTIGGAQFTALSTQTATIRLHGVSSATFTDTPANGWFSPGIIPPGVSVTASATGSDTITLNFSGVPLVMSTAIFDITIPASALQSRTSALPVEYNPDARFNIDEPALYNLSFSVSPTSSWGTVSGTGQGAYLVDSSVILVATPTPGYHFLNWQIDSGIAASDIRHGDLSSPAIQFFMPSNNVSLTAVFGQNPPATYSLTVIAEAGGNISGSPDGYCEATQTITETAVAAPDFHFIGWRVTGLDTTDINTMDSTISFPMPANAVTLTAMFEADPEEPSLYELNVSADSGGFVPDTFPRSFYPAGDAIRLTAVPDDGYHFDGWEASGIRLSAEERGNALLAFDMPARTVSIRAKFKANPPDTYSLTVMAGAGGSVSGSSSGPYKAEAAISVTADPEPGFHFVGWDINEDLEDLELDIRDNPARFAMPAANVTLTAIFAPTPEGVYALTVIASRGGSVSGTQSGVYLAGYHVEVTPTATSPYRFTGWRLSSNSNVSLTSRANPAEFDMPRNAVTLTARFSRPGSDSPGGDETDEPYYTAADDVPVHTDAIALDTDPVPPAPSGEAGPIPKTSDAGMGHWGALFGISLLGLFALAVIYKCRCRSGRQIAAPATTDPRTKSGMTTVH